MQKWLVVLLIFITAAGSFIPCCRVDDCCSDRTATSGNHDRHQPEGSCSPFFSCASCPGSVALPRPIQMTQPVKEITVHYAQVFHFHLHSYAASFWQPPRSC